MLACIKSLALNEGSQVALGLTLFKERMRERKRSAELQKNWHEIQSGNEGAAKQALALGLDREVGERKVWEVRKDMREVDGHLKVAGVSVVQGASKKEVMNMAV